MNQILLLSLLSMLFVGCKVSDNNITSSCSFSETHFGSGSTMYVFAGQKAAQRFVVTKNAKLKSINIQLDLLTSTSVNFTLVRAANGVSSPVGATTLSQATLVSNQVSNSGKILFSFPKAAVTPGENYFMIFEPVGGDIEFTSQAAFPFNVEGEEWRFNGSWSSLANWDLSFAVSGECQ